MFIDTYVNKHVTSDVVDAEVEAFTRNDEIISDRVAVTIASHYQSAGPSGSIFAQLSTTGKVDSEELRTAIESERRMFPYNLDLDALDAWIFEWECDNGA